MRDFSSGNHADAVETIFERARKLSPCLLAFEDIDGLVTQGNRTVFLNELDGFQNNDGLLIIASSNHPGKIDEALLKRPSRFDRVFHIGLPALAERRTYCERLLSRSSLADRLSPELDIPVLAQTVAEWSDGFTPAYLKEVFVSAALRRAQAGAMSAGRAVPQRRDRSGGGDAQAPAPACRSRTNWASSPARKPCRWASGAKVKIQSDRINGIFRIDR